MGPQSLVDFKLSSEIKEFQLLAREFAREEIRPAETRLDTFKDPADVFESEIFKSAMKKAYQCGFHKVGLPEPVGGLGLGPFAQLVILEELAVGGAGLASQILVCPIAASAIVGFGLAARHASYKDYLEAYVDDDQGIHSGAWAITEPGIGSDCLPREGSSVHFATRAEERAGSFSINGAKAGFVSNGGLSDFILLFACVEPSRGMYGTGIFLIPGDLEGISRGRPMDKLGLRALNQAEIFFDDVEIPKDFMAVPPGPMYPTILEMIVTGGNASVGAIALGIARAAYEEALEYAKTRIQGGKPIVEHQLVAEKLFKAFRSIEAARALIWKAAFAQNIVFSAAARTFASDMALEVTAEMVQIFGGYGISKEYPVEKFYRDAKLLQIMDGANEIVTLLAAEKLATGAI